MKVSVQRDDHCVQFQRECEYLLIGGTVHANLAHVRAFMPKIAKTESCISRKSLIKDQAHDRTGQAAVLSVARSSKLAAANARACRTSSGSNSG